MLIKPKQLACLLLMSGLAMAQAAPEQTYNISQGFAIVMSGRDVFSFTADDVLTKQIETITHIPSKVIITVRKIEDLKQKGCKRIGMDLVAPQAIKRDKDGKSVQFRTNMEMNLCPGGLPPDPAKMQ
jgi:hypothetical protein